MNSKNSSCKLLILTIGCLFLAIQVNAQNRKYYYSTDSFEMIYQDVTKLSIALNSNVSADSFNHTITGNPFGITLDTSQRLANNLYYIGIGSTSYSTAKTWLRGKPQVQFVESVYQFSNGDPLIPSNLLMVRFNNNRDSLRLDSLIGSLSLSKAGHFPLDNNIFYYKHSNNDSRNILDIEDSVNELPFVASVTTNCYGTAEPIAISNDPLNADNWALNSSNEGGIDAYRAWDVIKAKKKVKVAVFDEGISCSHEDLELCGDGYNALLYDPIFSMPINGGPLLNNTGCPDNYDYAHGTSVAGVIGAKMDNGKGVAGAGSGCGLLSIRIINKKYTLLTSSLTLYTAFTIAATYADIVNISYILHVFIPEKDLQYIQSRGRNGRGLSLLAGTGNTTNCGVPISASTVGYPSNLFDFIAVTGVNKCGTLKRCNDGCSSDQNDALNGPKPEVAAPFNDIMTTIFDPADKYGSKSGTSLSCGLASGVMALIYTANPYLTAAQARDVLGSTCDKTGSYSYINNGAFPSGTWSAEIGYGRINAYNAVLKARQIKTILLNHSGTNYLTAIPVTVDTSLSFTFAPYHPISYQWYKNGKPFSSLTSNYHSLTVTDIGTYCLKVLLDSFGSIPYYSEDVIFTKPCDEIGSPDITTELIGQVIDGTNPPEYQDFHIDADDYAFIGGNNYIGSNIIIDPGHTLTISGVTVKVRACAKIIVKPGAKLVIHNSRLQGCNGELWGGIEVQGTPTSGSRTWPDQGILIMDNHSVIRDAIVGISAGEYNTGTGQWQYGGGSLNLTNDSFENNVVHIISAGYSLNSNNSITGCYFNSLVSNTSACTQLPVLPLTQYAKGLYFKDANDYSFIHNVYNTDPCGNYKLQEVYCDNCSHFTFTSDTAFVAANTFIDFRNCNFMTIQDLFAEQASADTFIYIYQGNSNSIVGCTLGNTGGKIHNGVYVYDNSDLNIEGNYFNGCDNGVQGYHLFTAGINGNQINHNAFAWDKFGIVLAPEANPFDFSATNGNRVGGSIVSTSIHVQTPCNHFDSCLVGLYGEGNLDDQGSSSSPASVNWFNKYYDIMWLYADDAGHGTVDYYYDLRTSNGIHIASSLNSSPLLLNQILIDGILYGNGDNQINPILNTSPPPCNYWKKGENTFIKSSDPMNDDISVFPNPFGNILRLNIAHPDGSYKVILYNSTGQLISTGIGTEANYQLHTDALAPGIYLLEWLSGNTKKTFTVIRQ